MSSSLPPSSLGRTRLDAATDWHRRGGVPRGRVVMITIAPGMLCRPIDAIDSSPSYSCRSCVLSTSCCCSERVLTCTSTLTVSHSQTASVAASHSIRACHYRMRGACNIRSLGPQRSAFLQRANTPRRQSQRLALFCANRLSAAAPAATTLDRHSSDLSRRYGDLTSTSACVACAIPGEEQRGSHRAPN